jgi:hypothetical protein
LNDEHSSSLALPNSLAIFRFEVHFAALTTFRFNIEEVHVKRYLISLTVRLVEAAEAVVTGVSTTRQH